MKWIRRKADIRIYLIFYKGTIKNNNFIIIIIMFRLHSFENLYDIWFIYLTIFTILTIF